VRASGTVLVIDAESVVREAARAMLEKNGFEVLIAEKSREGVDLLRAEGQRISLIILDLTMPLMGGEQAFDLLRAVRPNVPILLASGYDETEAAARTVGKDFAGFIHKPFDVDRLLEAVSSAMGPE
jgi:DNA-binding NtrC family response regulator